MNPRPLLGFLAIAGLATSAFAQGSGIQFEATNRATFIYIQGSPLSNTARFDASTIVHVNAGFVVSSASRIQRCNSLGANVGFLPSADYPSAHSITMRVYWEPDPSATASVLPTPVAAGGSGKTTVFRSNIIIGDYRNGVPLRLTGVTFTAN